MNSATRISRIVVEFDDGSSMVVTSPDTAEVSLQNEPPIRYSIDNNYEYIARSRKFVTITAETDPLTYGTVEWVEAADTTSRLDNRVSSA